MRYADNSIFDGIFENDNFKTGKYVFPNGDYYEGEWENSKFNGQGKFVVVSEFSLKNDKDKKDF
jgi:hypothetical protein